MAAYYSVSEKKKKETNNTTTFHEKTIEFLVPNFNTNALHAVYSF